MGKRIYRAEVLAAWQRMRDAYNLWYDVTHAPSGDWWRKARLAELAYDAALRDYKRLIEGYERQGGKVYHHARPRVFSGCVCP